MAEDAGQDIFPGVQRHGRMRQHDKAASVGQQSQLPVQQAMFGWNGNGYIETVGCNAPIIVVPA